jgi:hypothetical protein
MRVTKATCPGCGVALEGDFQLSPLAQIRPEDQPFVIAFVRTHGSLKKMESLFGISYPTVKNRLNAIVEELDRNLAAPPSRSEVLDRLERGEISVDEALGLL